MCWEQTTGSITTSTAEEQFPAAAYLCNHLLGALVDRVLAQVHQLSEEQVPDLGEASAGRLHQSVQDGADVGLDADLQQLLSLGEHHSCTAGWRGGASEQVQTLTSITSCWHL